MEHSVLSVGRRLTNNTSDNYSFRQLSQQVNLPEPYSLRRLSEYVFEPQTYEIVVKTGGQARAGTDANVKIYILGSWTFIPEMPLTNSLNHSNPFQRGQTDVFQVVNQRIGDSLEMLSVQHDNTGVQPFWFLESVTIRNLNTNQSWLVAFNKWLASSSDFSDDCATGYTYIENSLDPDKLYPIPYPGGCTNTQPYEPPEPDEPDDPQPPPQEVGIKKFYLYNCDNDRRTVEIQLFDQTTGTQEELGPFPAQYNNANICGPGYSVPAEVTLAENHRYQIFAVDANDPDTVVWQDTSNFQGDTEGIEVPIVLN